MKKVLLGVILLSTLSIAATPKAGTFSNRFGISYNTKGSEKWDNTDTSANYGRFFDESIEVDYKLFYNITDRFRLGGELGGSYDRYSSSLKKHIEEHNIDSKYKDGTGTALLGITGEVDLYKNKTLSIYFDGSFGGALSKIKRKKSELKAKTYAKLGLGVRFTNGIGIEAGEKMISYDFDVKINETIKGHDVSFSDNNKMKRMTTYFELNYTF